MRFSAKKILTWVCAYAMLPSRQRNASAVHGRFGSFDLERPFLLRMEYVNLKTYTEKVESANKLAQRAGIAPSIIYRALLGADMKLNTARKIVEASGKKINFFAVAVEREDQSPSPDLNAQAVGDP
jgi:hypothetical protein